MTETSDTLPPPARKSRLALHLAIVLVIKAILLTLLWHAFIKPNKVKVNVDAMGAHLTGTHQLQHQEENRHDRFNGR